MAYGKHFAKKRIVPDIRGSELEDVLSELVTVFVKSGSVDAALGDKILALAVEKANAGATGAIGNGVAIPHVKLEGIAKTAVVVGRSSEGVDFRAGDGALVTVVFFIIGPVDAPESHLELLRWIAQIARDPDFERFALACKDASDIHDLLVELDTGA